MDDSILSAEKGAEQAAKRYEGQWGGHGPDYEDEENTTNYLCENCETHEFLVYRTYRVTKTINRFVACSCGTAENAVFKQFIISQTKEAHGRLDAGHGVEWEDGDTELLHEDQEEIDSEFGCPPCLKNATP